jgi:hypothetical protein
MLGHRSVFQLIVKFNHGPIDLGQSGRLVVAGYGTVNASLRGLLTRFHRFQNQLNSETLARRRRRRGNLVLNFVKFALLSAHFLQSPKAQAAAVDGFLTLAQAQFAGRIHGYEANR